MADESNAGAGAKATFGGEDFDWENYEQFRPSYPQSLFDAIFAFHARNNLNTPNLSNVDSAGVTSPTTGWEVAYDFGCGPGTTFAPLLSRFRAVVGVDVNRPQLDAILRRFEREAGEGRVKIVEGRAEDVAEAVVEGSVDLVITAEAIHWFDCDRWLEGVGRMLKRGGTLAVIQYSFDELDDEDANAIWQTYLRATLVNRPRPTPPPPPPTVTSDTADKGEKSANPPPPPTAQRNGGGMGLMVSLLDTLSIPSSLFTNETRTHWPTPFQSSSPFLPPASSPAYQSMRSPDCSFTAHAPSSPLLRQKRTKETLLRSLETLGNLVKREEEYDGGKEMRAAVDAVVEVYRKKYAGREEFEARWPCALVIATKK